MKKIFFSTISILFAMGVIISCGDNTEFLPGNDRYDVELQSLVNGDVLTRSSTPNAGTFIFFRIRGNDHPDPDLNLVTDLYNGKGDIIAHNQKTSPSVNSDSPIDLSSQIPQGQYDISISLRRGATEIAHVNRSFFLVNQPLAINGILSYPLVIFPEQTALLIADLEVPAGLDPYLKWSQGNKVIAKGPWREGYDQILWETPEEDGVYPIEVEVFPFPPFSKDDFSFTSPIKGAAELYISQKDKQVVPVRSAALKYNLFDIYISALRERERLARGDAGADKSDARRPLTQPVPVIIGESIGMKFDGRSGFTCPELVFPIRAAAIDPFAVTLGVMFSGDPAGRGLMSLQTNDRGLSIDLAFSEDGELTLRWKTKTEDFVIPSGISKLPPGLRALIELAVIPSGPRTRFVWKLNGTTISQIEKVIPLDSGDRKGSTVLGGENSVRCDIDTLNIVLQ